MKQILSLGILLALVLCFTSCQQKSEFTYNQRETNFNFNWKFVRADVENAELIEFDDSEWRLLDLPHDYSIEDLPAKEGVEQIGPFSKESPGNASTGNVMGGIGWYRKHFTIEKADKGKIIQVLFDGIYMNSDVWINGHHLGNHPYGYTAFSYDLTPHLNTAGKSNVLAVKVNNHGDNSRWYTGSGIYRNVKLIKTNPVHIKNWGNFITTPEVSEEKATINIKTSIDNRSNSDSETKLVYTIKNQKNAVLIDEKTILLSTGSDNKIENELVLENPKLWDTENPNMYTAIIQLKQNDKVIDETQTRFGIRSIEFSPLTGFLLNGKHTLIKGGCVHHDNGILGSAAFKDAEYRRVKIMKEAGFNGIRCAHNPPSEELLNACDELGMLVMNESFDIWQVPKRDDDYTQYFDEWWERDTESMMLRDRNHPSIIIWSVGNEISERGFESGLKIFENLIKKTKEFDTTRPVTQAVCRFWEHPGKPWEDTEPIFEMMDVHGYNYQWARYEEDNKNFPERIMVGTESVAGEAFENWQQVKNHSYVIGDFSWTGMDYFGEAGIGHNRMKSDGVIHLAPWPWYNAYCGDISVLGYKKPQMFYRDVIWGNSDLEILAHEPIPEGDEEVVSFWGWPNEWKNWNWQGAEGKPIQVSVYSRCEEVKLELNGKEIATKPVSEETKQKALFEFTYQPGELTAIGFVKGVEIVHQTLKTSGKPAQLKITPETEEIINSSQNLAWFNVEVLDENGLLVSDVAIPVEFELPENVVLQAVGNGNPSDMKSFQKPRVNTFRGKCQLIVRAGNGEGEVSITAKSEGLKSGQCKIQVTPKQ